MLMMRNHMADPALPIYALFYLPSTTWHLKLRYYGIASWFMLMYSRQGCSHHKDVKIWKTGLEERGSRFKWLVFYVGFCFM